jgi:uncharacterized protein YjiS (DUF1127 family)
MSIPIDRGSPSRDIAPSALFPSSAAVWGLIANAHLTVARWFARSRQRRALREIAERNDLHVLKDIGVSQEEALREADKAFWRL